MCPRGGGAGVGQRQARIGPVYDQHSYLPEMREALEAWAAELGRIVGVAGLLRSEVVNKPLNSAF